MRYGLFRSVYFPASSRPRLEEREIERRGVPARRIENTHAEAMISKKQNIKNNKNLSKYARGRTYPMNG